MDVEVYEFEPGRWSYKINGVASGETFPARQSALIAAEMAKGKQAEAPSDPALDKAIDPQI